MKNIREKLIELLKDSPSLDALDDDGYATGADHLIANGVVVRKHGRWVIYDDDFGGEFMCCSQCKAEFYDGMQYVIEQLHNYCPNCGAKMDLRGETE